MTRPIVLDMLEEHERLKTEAATPTQLARDLYDGKDITPEAALRRLHEECMAATARVVELEEEVRLVRRDAVFLKNITTDEPRLAEIRARRDGSYEGETVRDLLRDMSWLIIAVDRFKAELEEQRLTLLAELESPEGAVAGWAWSPEEQAYVRALPDGTRLAAVKVREPGGGSCWYHQRPNGPGDEAMWGSEPWITMKGPPPRGDWCSGSAPLVRRAMRDADTSVTKE